MRTKKFRIALVSTGGTIEKTYDELEGVLHNAFSVLDVMLAQMYLDGVDIDRVSLMNKDSREMTPEDHALIAVATKNLARDHQAIVIIHGTDRLSVTGEQIAALEDPPAVPVILTGAIRPYMLRNTDANQNLTEAMLAAQILEPGVYCVMHNKVLQFPGVEKDFDRGTFRRTKPRDEGGGR